MAETSPRRGPHGTRKRKKLVQFSPYNRVQLISPRKPGDNQHVQQLYQSIREGKFENSEDEDSDEGVFPFLHPMFGGMGMFFHHMLYAHSGVDSSEGSSSEED